MGAMEGLMEAGILVIPGAQGDADVVTAAYLDGSLSGDDSALHCGHHGHQGEGSNGECSNGECSCH